MAKEVQFKAFCPLEVGDTLVITGKDGKEYEGKITDIACINYCVSGETEFRFEIDGNRRYIKLA